MKISLFLPLGALLALCACQPDNPTAEANVQVLPAEELQVGPVRHDTLTSSQLARATHIQQVFAEVYPSSLEETIDNFKRDAHPDRELAVWETMAAAYTQYLQSQPQPLSLLQKKDVFALLLSRSMMAPDQVIANAKLKVLTKAEAGKVLGYYESKPAPLTVAQ